MYASLFLFLRLEKASGFQINTGLAQVTMKLIFLSLKNIFFCILDLLCLLVIYNYLSFNRDKSCFQEISFLLLLYTSILLPNAIRFSLSPNRNKRKVCFYSLNTFQHEWENYTFYTTHTFINSKGH